MQISIIIVSYNVKEFLQQCILSLQKSLEGIQSEIIVVDNDSVDGSDVIVEHNFPDVKLIRNHENVGFAKACNQGLKIAGGEYLLLLNPDTMIQEDTFRIMLDFFNQDNEIGAAGCKIMNADGTLQLACRRSFPTPAVAIPKMVGLSRIFPGSRWFGRYNLTYENPDKLLEVDAVSGSFLMFRKKVFEQIGGLDEDFFMYGEDLDYCYRIKSAGWKIYYVPYTKIIHYKGESTKLASFDNFITFYKAMDIFVRKHFSKSSKLLLDIFLRFGIVVRGFVSLIGKFIRRHSVMIVDGFVLMLAILLAHRLQPRPLPPYETLISMVLFYLLLWLGTGYAIGLYDRRDLSYSKAAVASIASFVLSVLFNYLFKGIIYTPQFLIFSFLIVTLFLPGWRIALMLMQRRRMIRPSSPFSRALLSRRTILVGAGPEGERIAEKLKSHIEHGFEILGFVDKKYHYSRVAGFPFLGVADDLAEIIRINKATEVIFTTDRFSNDNILSLMDRLRDVRINMKIVPRHLDFILGKSSVEKIEDIPLVNLDYNIYHFANKISKRLFDILIAAIGTFVITPVIVPYAYASGCRLRRKRFLGLEGRRFTSWIFYRKNGRGIRKNLMFFPLIWSVFTGDASMVGSELLSAENHKKYLRCKPGITGLFQVQGNHKPDEIDKQNYEYYYIQNHSLFLDIEILVKAILRI